GSNKRSSGSPKRRTSNAQTANSEGEDVGVKTAVEKVTHKVAAALSTSDDERAGIAKKLSAVVREIAEAAVSLRVQRDEAGDLELFFPEEGQHANGVEVAEVGADAYSEDEDNIAENESRDSAQENGKEVNGSSRG